MPRSSFAKATALITGGSRRIGREIARACAHAGMNVVIHYRTSKSEALALAYEIETQGVRAWAIRGTLDTPAACERLVSRADVLCNRSLSLLVNNASSFPESSLSSFSFKDLTDAVGVNAWAPLCLSRAFAGLARSGSIVNLLDARIAGRDRTHAAYILSKHLLAVLTKTCALEFAPVLRVNGVAPGLILPPAGKTNAYLRALTGTVPLKMHGDPLDIARTVVFLAQSPFITGEIIFVDGGRHLVRDISAL